MGGLRNMMGTTQTLEKFISDALQWKPHEWKNFTEEWKYKDVLKMLPKERANVDNVLAALNIKSHSIPFSYLLGFKAQDLKMDDINAITIFIKLMHRFIREADRSNVSLYPRPFTDALRVYVDIMKNDKNYLPLIDTLRQCVLLLQGSSENRGMLTFAHCDFVYCCVKTYCYHQAFPLVDYDIIQVQGGGCIRSIDNLRYFYYCGLVQIGVKKYKEAMEALTMVCTAPSDNISLIQIDAYKKYILCSLIRKQRFDPLPRYTPRILNRYFPKFCSEYLDLNKAFDSKANSGVVGRDVLHKTVEKNLDLYLKDQNYGLVKKVVESGKKNSVKKLTSVYTKLSMQKVQALCRFKDEAEAKRIVLDMIRDGDLSASIDAEGVVTFYDGTITESDEQMLKRMQSGIEKTLNLWNGLDGQQLKVKTSKEYISKSLNLGGGMGGDQQQLLLESQMGGMMGGIGGGFFGR